MRALLVGESNPYSEDPEYALYPFPAGTAGARLREITGLTVSQYLRAFDRVNLFAPAPKTWGLWEARRRAGVILGAYPKTKVIILLGARVAAAFDYPIKLWEARAIQRGRVTTVFIRLPHPSGRCREWNEPDALSRARTLLSTYITEVKR